MMKQLSVILAIVCSLMETTIYAPFLCKDLAFSLKEGNLVAFSVQGLRIFREVFQLKSIKNRITAINLPKSILKLLIIAP